MTENEDNDPRMESVLQVAQRYDPDPAHSRQVARLALKIFDDTAPLHRLDDLARELLEYACLLHDIGWSGGERKHKRRSYEMVKAAELVGLSDAEREIIASVARYHGSKPPKEDHPWNLGLSPEDKRKVRYLSAIIRVADALDRTHRAVVEDIGVSIAHKSAAPTTDLLSLPSTEDGTPAANCSDPLPEVEGRTSGPPPKRLVIVLKLKTSQHPDAEIWALRRKKDYFERTFGARLQLL